MRNILRNIFYNEAPLTERDYQRSRVLSVFEGCTARTVGTLTGGAFLAGLVKYIGGDDRTNGVIAAIPTLSAAVMMFAPLVFERVSKRKFLITFIAFFSRLLLSFVIFIPLLFRQSTLSLLALTILYMTANLSVSFINPAASTWQISLTSEQNRGKYFGMRESYILGFVTLASLAMGRILDHTKELKLENEGFMILFIIVLLFAIVNFLFASSICEPPVKLNSTRLSGREIILQPLKNENYRRIIGMMILWNFGFQLSGPFTAVYMVSGLKLNYTFISITAMLSAAASVVSARLLGRIADKKSWFHLLMICMGFQAASQFIWLFVNADTALFFIPLAQFLGGAALGGVNISLNNIQYQYSPEQGKIAFIGFSSAVGGLIGFVGVLAGSALISVLSKVNIVLYGFHIGNMQTLFGVSCLLLLGCIIFTKIIEIKVDN